MFGLQTVFLRICKNNDGSFSVRHSTINVYKEIWRTNTHPGQRSASAMIRILKLKGNYDLNSKVEDLDKDIARQENKLRTIKHAALLKEAELMKDFAASCQN